jgi:hypothetical protein
MNNLIKRVSMKSLFFQIKKITLLVAVLFQSITSLAYIPSSKMILDKVVENNTTGPILYEQSVVINGGGLSATLKETWLVENESTMVVLVQGEKELKDKIQFAIQYNGKRKLASIGFIKQSENITSDFLEPIFFMKSQQKLIPYLVSSGIVGPDIYNSSNFQKQKDHFIHMPENFVRLGRTGGVVAYIISGNNGIEAKLPGLWIEQDQFLLRKIRNSKKTEMSVESWGNYSRGWKLPKERSFVWDDKSASVKMLDVKVPQPNIKSLIVKSQDIKSLDYENSREKILVEEFYLKLR